MKVYVDNDNCIRAVGFNTNASLKELTIKDAFNPFKTWSKARICCYKVNVEDGMVTMMTPYIDSQTLDMIDTLGKQVEQTDKATSLTGITVDEVMTEIIPSLAEKDESLTSTLDSILTEIIPSLMSE